MSDYRIAPIGLLNKGLTVNGSQVDGVNLLTFGFVATCFSPFVPPGGTAITTSWTGATGVIFGPC